MHDILLNCYDYESRDLMSRELAVLQNATVAAAKKEKGYRKQSHPFL